MTHFASIHDVKEKYNYPGLPGLRIIHKRSGVIRLYTQFDKDDVVKPHKILFFFRKAFHKKAFQLNKDENKPIRCFYKERDGKVRDCGLWIPRRILDMCIELKKYRNNM